MNQIQTNKPVFFGNDGDVLKSGRIYIGQPNQYPVTFPKTVTFQDSSGAQFEAQQPLRTNDEGRISFNGKAIIALVDGNYSLLVQDRNGVQISDGYTPFVSNPGEAEVNLGSVTQVGLLLSDIKLLEVTPGDTVRNVGKITATDGLGADWLVVSNTGSPGDDETLIDFANGTQGQRSRQTTESLSDYEEFDLLVDTGDFAGSSFTMRFVKIGKAVTATSLSAITHASSTFATSGIIVPQRFRPIETVSATHARNVRPPDFTVFTLNAAGEIRLNYYDSTITSEAGTGSVIAMTLSYNVN